MKKIYISDQEIMDKWNYIFNYLFPNDELLLRYRRTQHAYVLNAFRSHGKSIGCVYVFGLRKYPDNKIHGYVARVYVNKKFRNSGIATKMLGVITKDFGDCVLHISSASPNRIDGLTDENREEYRNKLYKFYGRFGFCRTSEKHTGMIRYPTEKK